MVEALHLGALLPAAVGACCTVGGRRGIVDLGAAIVMLVAMIDVATGTALLHPLVWGAVLVVVGIVSAARLRGGGAIVLAATAAGADSGAPAAAASARAARGSGAGSGSGAARRHRLMVVHTSLGLLVMAALLMAMAAHGSHAALGISSSVSHHGAAATGTFGIIVAAGSASYVAFTAWLAAAAVRSGRVLTAVELTSMALSLTAMAFANAA